MSAGVYSLESVQLTCVCVSICRRVQSGVCPAGCAAVPGLAGRQLDLGQPLPPRQTSGGRPAQDGGARRRQPGQTFVGTSADPPRGHARFRESLSP